MNRLHAQWQRLYAPVNGGVRGLVLEVTGPDGWDALSAVWHGVQAELDLPAPAIAVSGSDALQLWLSLAEPVPAPQALDLLEVLRRRYLAGVRPERVRGRAVAAQDAPIADGAPAPVGPERWSAFIAPDLAPLFSGEPWLDQAPGREAQADLLARFVPASTVAFTAACARLQPPATPAASDEASTPAKGLGPREFLRAVMHDPQAPLALRIEAAKALLPVDGRAD